MNRRSALSIVLFAVACSTSRGADELKVDFARQIKPILAERCVVCHNAKSLYGDLNLQSREQMMRPRKQGPVLVAGQPEKSLLYVVLTLPPSEQKAMPATAHRIAKSDIALVRQWIAEGAQWPAGDEGTVPVPPKPKAE
jgi:mono/diheme cytochrome c family protein